MSVEVEYNGQFGNNLFQYVCARLFAKDNGLRLRTPFFVNKMVEALAQEGGESVEGAPIILGDRDQLFSKKYPTARYSLHGFFLCGDWYHSRREQIRGFIRPMRMFEKNTQDFAIHCRLKDYRRGNWVIHPSWYLSILKRETFKTLYIVTDELDREYFDVFRPYDPLFLSSKPEDDWEFLRSFDRVAISMSTFSWWAVFLGNASKVYVFKRYQFGMNLNKFPNRIEIDGRLLHEI